MEYPGLKLAVITEGQSGGAKKRPRPVKKEATNRQKLKSYADLSPGDLVVHEHHGVGRYVGMVKMPADGIEKDYVKIAYAGTDVLYVPATQLDLVSKYIGGGEDAQETKKLSKLGGTDWERAKTKAKKAVADLAKGLIQLYAQRQRQPGFAFSPDSPWQREFEEQFEYSETEDVYKRQGKGGSVIQKITAESGATVDIEDDGTIHIASPNAEACDAAKKMIDTIVFVPQVGELYYGKVVRILQFGAFVERCV